LQLSLLGSPVVTRDGSAVTFDTRKAVALLAILAVEQRPQPRDRLAALLWPDADATRARSALRRTLSVTGQAVGAALEVARATVALEAAATTCDIAEFRRLTAAGDAASLRRAAALYRDDFLAGFSLRDSAEFEEWHAEVASTFRRQLAVALGRLVDAEVADGNLDAGVETAQRWLSLDPLHEPAHHMLMRLYAWRGERSAAMRQFRACVRILDSELGVEPLDETQALYAAIRRNELPPKPSAPAPVPAEAVAAAPPRVSLVGRDNELMLLRQTLARVGSQGVVAVVTGPTGVGKTALLRAAEELLPAGVLTLAVRCHPEESALAYGVAIDLVRGLLAAAPDTLAALPRHVRAELARLVPETADLDGPAQTADAAAAAARLFAAVRELIQATGRAVAVSVDDAQWLDRASGDLLAYLLRRLPSTPVAVVVAQSSELPAEPATLLRAARDAVADGLGVELRLQGLDRASLAALVGSTVGAGAVDVDQILTDTGGLPSLVTAYLATVAAGGDPTAAAASLAADLLAQRVAALSQTAQQVLAAAAILAGRADPEVLRDTSGRSEAETVTALEEALRAGLVVELPGGVAYDLPFEALRRCVLDQTTFARRRLLHHRAARALARRATAHPTPADAGAVAHHLREAGRGEEAAEWHWRAATEARRLHAHDEALDDVRAALALGHPAAEGRLAEGELLIALGRYAEALTALERAAAVAEPVPQMVQVERRLADVHHRLGGYDVADAHVAAALELADGTVDATVVADLLAERALLAHRRGAFDEARRHGERAVLAAADSPSALATALNVLGVVAAAGGDGPGAQMLFRQALERATQAEDDSAAIAALNNLSRLLDQEGAREQALATAAAALERGLRLGDRHRIAALHTNLADLLRAAGREAEAMDHLKQAAVIFADLDDVAQRRPEIWKLVEW
ncbi:MAG TPA: AAA family ATPase, partial [Mycobacteriales bacterium]|nr:AAA family ATPase [Mycobacteriales bacterium]